MGRVDVDEVAGLTSRLVRAASENPPGREGRVAELFAEQADRWGLRARMEPVAPGRTNVLVTSRSGGGDAPSLLYCGHLDTVPAEGAGWRDDPFSGRLVGGRVYGRGSVDMKGGLAAMLGALAALRAARPECAAQVTLAAVVGEEVDCAGSRALVAGHDLSGYRWLVIGEPTGLSVVVAQKGALHLRVTLTGRAAHGAHPERGVNAVQHMAQVITAVGQVTFPARGDTLVGAPTVSVNTVTGGSATNIVPDSCSAALDLRTVPGQDHRATLTLVDEAVARVVDRVEGLSYRVDVLNDRPPCVTDPGNPLVVAAQRTARDTVGGERPVHGVSYYSDASVLQPAMRVPAILFGPGEIDAMHQVDESVAVADLAAATRFFTALPPVLVG